jgi:hypothetical protein
VYTPKDGAADMKGARYVSGMTYHDGKIDEEGFARSMTCTDWCDWFVIRDDNAQARHESDYEIIEFLPWRNGQLTQYSCMPSGTDQTDHGSCGVVVYHGFTIPLREERRVFYGPVFNTDNSEISAA